MQSNQEFALIIHNVHKHFRNVQALRGASFLVEKGTIHALLGPNGAGKTTLLRIIAGIIKPDYGQVIAFNMPPGSPELIGLMGYMTQNTVGYQNITAWKNVTLFAEIAGIDKQMINEKTEYLFSELEIMNLKSRKFKELSGGEKRTVNLIRTIIIGDKLLLLDEPTAGLDLERAAKVRKLIQKLSKEGRTILLSSHIVTDLENLSQYITILHSGKTIFTGTKEQAIDTFTTDEKRSLENALLNAFDNNPSQNNLNSAEETQEGQLHSEKTGKSI